tara:strand:- start:48 stop:299 length:252 start_codon:yes stop_codon:yes gene_type:complete
MEKRIKVKHWVKTPATVELRVVDKELYEKHKSDLQHSLLQDEDGVALLDSDYLEQYGLERVDETFEEDIVNREIHDVDEITDV